MFFIQEISFITELKLYLKIAKSIDTFFGFDQFRNFYNNIHTYVRTYTYIHILFQDYVMLIFLEKI